MKQFLEWRDEWTLGIEIIDRQHRDLAKTFNKLVALYINDGGQITVEQRSNQLHEQLSIFSDKVREHFDDEETLMLKTNYSGYTQHAHAHLMLRAELKQYMSHIEEELDRVDLSALNSLKVWFISHIVSNDKEFADFLHMHSQDEVILSSPVDT